MNRITIEIYLPSAAKTFDVSIPIDMYLHQVTELAAKILTELSGGFYSADETSVLCDKNTGAFLNGNMMVWELELQNGSQLMLI